MIMRETMDANGSVPDSGRAKAPGRRRSLEVRIGGVAIGGDNPVAVQTMTDTTTSDTEACAAQIARIRAAGCRIVRLTTRTNAEAANLSAIRDALRLRDITDVALVADVHFSPGIALTAADHADKVRINPGNFNDPDGNLLSQLIDKCRSRGAAIRIGVNHGSLSPEIVDELGDTPQGMVESAMRMLRRCRDAEFHNVVVSMKSSNVRVMVHAYRLLVVAMEREDMRYPLHLGVTEAGDGADGRIKSALGIASLLADGVGDTIRVSLTEPPENEVPVARTLAGMFAGDAFSRKAWDCGHYSPFAYRRRAAERVGNVGGGQPPVLYGELDTDAHAALEQGRIAEVGATGGNIAAETRDAIVEMDASGDRRPVIVSRMYDERSLEKLQIMAAAETGLAMLDGLADGIRLENRTYDDGGTTDAITVEALRETALSILQASRTRISKTEYIACPGCGRTLFNLQATLRAVRERTSHLKGLKIGVMGCIVNGPGEMADADYGYVGAGPGTVVLYKGRQPVSKPLPQAEAVEALVELIKAGGDWRD